MASSRKTKKKPFSETAFARYFTDLAEAVGKGDWKVKSSLAIMGSVDSRDRYTEGKSALVAEYSKKIAELSGKSEKECNEIYYAALFHNIGELSIPESLLSKSGRLTEEEEKIVRDKRIGGSKLLGTVSENPKLSDAAKYCMEKYIILFIYFSIIWNYEITISIWPFKIT